MMKRRDGRSADLLRPVTLELGAAPLAEGSCLVSMGSTRVLCAVTVERAVPAWRRPEEGGWVTAEYAMLPRSTAVRTPRERTGARGRTQEIQRFIGRALRAAVDLRALGPLTLLVDCDVLQADGGTRTAAVNGGCVAVWQALDRLAQRGEIQSPFIDVVSAVSAGIVDGEIRLDLNYEEDVAAEADFNIVALGDGRLVEIQGTAERRPFSDAQLHEILALAAGGLAEIAARQRAVMEAAR